MSAYRTLRDLTALATAATAGTALVAYVAFYAGGFPAVALALFAWGIVLVALTLTLGDAWARRTSEASPQEEEERRFWGGGW